MSAVSKRDSDLLSRELFQRQLAVERQQEQLIKIKEPAEPVFRGSAISDITQPMSPFPEASVASVSRDRAELQRMTVLELREILRGRGETIGKKNKAQLIDAIMS
jgi:hypothetical protein